jgi:phosphopantetheinyl transferase (holo-ACP synthase)
MIVGHGVDVADCDRVRWFLTTMEEDFLLGTFTRAERSVGCDEHDRVAYFAVPALLKEVVGSISLPV